jgi:hypothetical protein
MEKIYLGFSATAEKKKVGALVMQTFAYMQARDNYNLEVLAGMSRWKDPQHGTTSV